MIPVHGTLTCPHRGPSGTRDKDFAPFASIPDELVRLFPKVNDLGRGGLLYAGLRDGNGHLERSVPCEFGHCIRTWEHDK